MDDKQIKQHVQDALNEREHKNQYNPSPIASHLHTGVDSSQIPFSNISSGALPGTYSSLEYDNEKVTTTATINWANGNVQYITLTGNTTFAFINPQIGMRAILQVAGAFTPTFPASVRWSAGTTPTATATAGHKDIYSFIYSGKESLYDGVQSPNFATT
jgi:hypothetical protein